MNGRKQMEEKAQWEAQYWWAFSCLVLAGRRTAADFHSELLRRSSGMYPTPEQVEAIVDEAIGHLGDVFNAALADQVRKEQGENGWKRHVLALTMKPESASAAFPDE